MTSQEQIPASLPNTQNADGLTQTQTSQETSSQPTQAVWGRLWSIRPCIRSLEMINDSYTVGRSESCDCIFTSNEVQSKWLTVMSKVHFRIYRERICDTDDIVVYLEDLSSNGTFIDKAMVGRGNRVIIESNSEIALCKPYFSELKVKYALGRKLGSGACGEVKMIFTKNGSQKFALKTIQKNGFSANGNPFNDPEKIRNEVEILRKLKHSCIIHMEEICDTPSTMYIVLELMEGGELFDRIRSRGKLSESCAKLIFYQVVLAVHYLHKQGITHRDLKPENILLANKSDITLTKVSDFGMSKLVDAESMLRTFCGTPMYVAPEILTTLGRSSYTNQVDVWSLGVILYACLSGSVPFNIHRTDIPLEAQIRRGLYGFPQSLFGHVSRNATELIKSMLTVNPRRRITVRQILLHPWLADFRMREIVNSLMSHSPNDSENDENLPPLNTFENRQRADEIFPESAKRARLNA
ncbi:serine/threonine-protein kinase Chk2 isoform X2 [Ooceraea biroi]|uniref:serine/threonine-protein kinase Chk2 isoform X2 n=1 Tax=Ooceraea biroi TaxID=2015173 RepID=UPI0005BD7417|nr:serine/threonine-protein kinase Chk2 isoform X2 [Ooceraea biroi]